MKLFNPQIKKHSERIGKGETDFQFLERCEGEEFNRCRAALEKWFAGLPDPQKVELRRRLSGKEFKPAFFELYCFAILSAQGYQIDFHPKIPGSTASPDFAVRSKSGSNFLLECTLANQPIETTTGRTRLDVACEVVRQAASDVFSIGITVLKVGNYSPPTSTLRSLLIKELSQCDHLSLWHSFTQDGYKSMPKWQWRHVGSRGEIWHFELFPIPRSPQSAKTKNIDGVAMIRHPVQLVTPEKSLKNALHSKGTKYGKLDLPFVIAVNSLDIFVDEITISNSLFGTETFRVNVKTGDSTMDRKPDGFWHGPNGPKNRRVSAVLAVTKLYPWSAAAQIPVIWHNPWASHPLPHSTFSIPQKIPNLNAGEMQDLNGALPENLFE